MNYATLARLYLQDLNQSLIDALNCQFKFGKINKISLLRKQYEDIINYINEIKFGFSFYLLLTSVNAFHELVFIIFYVMSIPLYDYDDDTLPLNNGIILGLWAIVMLFCFLVAVYSCESVITEVSVARINFYF